jgi:Tol biopolymer transport system component
MSQYSPNLKRISILCVAHIFLLLLISASLLSGCTSRETKNGIVIVAPRDGIVFIAPRGSNSPAQSVVWSPSDENKILIRAYETPFYPSEIYMLDIRNQEKDFLVGPLRNAQFIDINWAPDGKKALILVVDTIGFEPSGWWAIDVNNKSVEHLLGPYDDASWSPDESTIAVLRRTQINDPSHLELRLIDSNTNNEEIIASYDEVNYSAGISWSPDNQFVVFSLRRQNISNLFILNVGTKKIIQLTQNNDSEYPAWSPKGNIIVFERDFSNKVGTSLYLVDVDGKCMIEIPNLGEAWSPTWSPDGKKIAFLSRDGIYVLETDIVFGRDIYQGLCP